VDRASGWIATTGDAIIMLKAARRRSFRASPAAYAHRQPGEQLQAQVRWVDEEGMLCSFYVLLVLAIPCPVSFVYVLRQFPRSPSSSLVSLIFLVLLFHLLVAPMNHNTRTKLVPLPSSHNAHDDTTAILSTRRVLSPSTPIDTFRSSIEHRSFTCVASFPSFSLVCCVVSFSLCYLGRSPPLLIVCTLNISHERLLTIPSYQIVSLTISGVSQHLVFYYMSAATESGPLHMPPSVLEFATLKIMDEYLDNT
jgi:hypothetical protein